MPETNKEITERIVRLETCVKLKFDELEKALVLARTLAKDERDSTRAALDYRLKGMNEFQKRMDKLEGTFVTKKDLDTVSKIVYTGFGILVALQFICGVVVYLLISTSPG